MLMFKMKIKSAGRQNLIGLKLCCVSKHAKLKLDTKNPHSLGKNESLLQLQLKVRKTHLFLGNGGP